MLNKTVIEKYFNAEKNQSAAMMVLGIAAMSTAVFLFIQYGTSFEIGVAVAWIILGAAMTLQWCRVFIRCDIHCMKNLYYYEMNTSALQQEELPRIKKTIHLYAFTRHIASVLLVAGLLLYGHQGPGSHDFFRGLGAGLSLLAFFYLIAAGVAELRAKNYFIKLETFFSPK